jgi:flavodoxin
MKKVIALLTVMILIFALAGCGANSTQDQKAASTSETQSETAAQKDDTPTASNGATEQSQTNESTNKTLVVYFSATGTTKGVAEQIASFTGADIYEITAAQPYTADDLNYNDSNSRTTIEQNDRSVRPEIGSDEISLDGYDTIFIGYPIWWGEEPRIMDTFVESYDFIGKTVIPFCTSSSSGIGASGSNLASNAGTGNWLEGERLSNSSDIEGWLESFQ